MARSPSEWTVRDWSVITHALLRTRWQADLDDGHALELCRELGETKGVPIRDLLETGRAPNDVSLDGLADSE